MTGGCNIQIGLTQLIVTTYFLFKLQTHKSILAEESRRMAIFKRITWSRDIWKSKALKPQLTKLRIKTVLFPQRQEIAPAKNDQSKSKMSHQVLRKHLSKPSCLSLIWQKSLVFKGRLNRRFSGSTMKERSN